MADVGKSTDENSDMDMDVSNHSDQHVKDSVLAQKDLVADHNRTKDGEIVIVNQHESAPAEKIATIRQMQLNKDKNVRLDSIRVLKDTVSTPTFQEIKTVAPDIIKTLAELIADEDCFMIRDHAMTFFCDQWEVLESIADSFAGDAIKSVMFLLKKDWKPDTLDSPTMKTVVENLRHAIYVVHKLLHMGVDELCKLGLFAVIENVLFQPAFETLCCTVSDMFCHLAEFVKNIPDVTSAQASLLNILKFRVAKKYSDILNISIISLLQSMHPEIIFEDSSIMCMEILTSTLVPDPIKWLVDASLSINLSDIKETESPPIYNFVSVITSIEEVLPLQQACLEVWVNATSFKDTTDADKETDSEELDDKDSVMEVDSYPVLPEKCSESLYKYWIIEKLLRKAKFLPKDALNILKEKYPLQRLQLTEISTAIDDNRILALNVLENIIMNMEVEKIGGSDKLIQIGTDVITILSNCIDTIPVTVAITGVLRAIFQVMNDHNDYQGMNWFLDYGFTQVLTVTRMQFFTINDENEDDGNDGDGERLWVNIIQIKSNIGMLIGKRTKAKPWITEKQTKLFEDHLEWFVNFVLDEIVSQPAILGMNHGLWLMAEALDAVMDVFAEDDYNHILKGSGLLAKMKNIRTTFMKEVFKQLKRQTASEEHEAVFKTVTDNLGAFIKYKVSH